MTGIERGRKITQHRHKALLSTKKLASLVGITRQTMSKYEKGLPIKHANLLIICKVLKIGLGSISGASKAN